MNKAVELLPCPFCGVKPELEHCGEGQKVSIDCINLDCDIQPQLIQTRRDIPSALKSWNTRTTPSLEAIIAKIEAEKISQVFVVRGMLSEDKKKYGGYKHRKGIN